MSVHINSMKKVPRVQSGFTIIELMVSIGILAIIFALSSINLSGLPQSSSQSAAIDTLLSDIRSQQTQAMASNVSSGIHFGTTNYTLTPSNFTVDLDPGITFSNVTFSGGNLIFAAGSGETTSGSFSLATDQVNITKVININKYGATY